MCSLGHKLSAFFSSIFHVRLKGQDRYSLEFDRHWRTLCKERHKRACMQHCISSVQDIVVIFFEP